MNNLEKIKEELKNSISIKEKILTNQEILENIKKSAEVIISALKNGKKLLICGNGGSAADSQHFAGEMIGRYKKERKAFKVIALTTDTSIITAWSNDYSFDTVFARQVEGLGEEGDVLFAISTSGNSVNVIKACEKAREKGLKIIGLAGKDGGQLKNYADICIIVPSNDTPRIQESHITIIHILCNLIESELA